MLAFLERERHGAATNLRPSREAWVQITIKGASGSTDFYELVVNLDSASVTRRDHLVGKHPYIDSAYMQAVENACRADPRVEAEIQKLKLPAGATVVVEPWAYATDGMNDMSDRTSMVRGYLRLLVLFNI